jgi:hypothetical protein
MYAATHTVAVSLDSYSNRVDLYNNSTGNWANAQLSVARSGAAATSVGNMAIFAGGSVGGTIEMKCYDHCCLPAFI